MTATDADIDVLRVRDTGAPALAALAARFGLTLVPVSDEADIPGSFWGAPEAGLVGLNIYVRGDTPVHSFLHEFSHVICMDGTRRAALDRDAGGTDLEESAVCYLQILLADELPGVGSARLMQDMDRWGYSFRLGSTARWFAEDAADALGFLRQHDLVDARERPAFRLRDAA